jgi:uncharacterized lipoprotein YddW (UPF0748 family)
MNIREFHLQAKAAGGSRTPRPVGVSDAPRTSRSVLECGCPLPLSLAVALVCFISLLERAATTNTIIDSCEYATDAAPRAAWQPMRGSAPAASAVVDGRKVLRLPCDFAGGKIDRASWDRKVRLDLSNARGVQFRLLCRDSSPVSYFSFYLQSGEGWYHTTFFPESTKDWNTVEIDKKDMKPEGKPGGWDQIKTIRISAWRATDVSTEIYLSDLWTTEALPPPGPREFAKAAIANIGKIASYRTYNEAVSGIVSNKQTTSCLTCAASFRADAINLLDKRSYGESKQWAENAHAQLLEAYCRAQKPLAGEFRGFWCHSAFGVEGMDWDEAIKRLADNGFNAIFPNMLWGGAAFYPSKVLPVASQVATRGDQIAKCLAACRKYGVQIHVWKVDWNLGTAAPKAFVAQMRQAGRLQASAAGKEEPWLCPSHPDNQQLEIAALLEVVRNYDVDGIHFDYIRYPGNDHCFCADCKERFEKAVGATLRNWPADVLADGPLRAQWLDWRRANITTVVRSVSQQARALKPRLQISAAVFRNWSVDRDGVGQDWKVWCDQDYLDFVCPMDYTPLNSLFENEVARQVHWAGHARCYPGLGVSASSSRFGADRAIEQINITRRYGTRGFMIFNYGARESRELLPLFGMGITAKQ